MITSKVMGLVRYCVEPRRQADSSRTRVQHLANARASVSAQASFAGACAGGLDYLYESD
jgi:hypothetical protein